jgi:hypothetical protein
MNVMAKPFVPNRPARLRYDAVNARDSIVQIVKVQLTQLDEGNYQHPMVHRN